MKSQLETFYESEFHQDGMPPFSELTVAQKANILNSLEFGRWQMSQAVKKLADTFGVTLKQACENVAAACKIFPSELK